MEPLASTLRPKMLHEFIGQEHLTGKGKPLSMAIEKKHLFSFILWGPPGVGKTTLARIYAKAMNAEYHELSAVSAGKDDIRKIVEDKHGFTSTLFGPKILFLDEIHRFNKAQQDFLLPYVEKGVITLIGATTENPSFEVNSALLSRARVFVLNELSHQSMRMILDRTGYTIEENAIEWLLEMASGDARQMLTMIENTRHLYGDITVDTLVNTLQSKTLRYDKKGEDHYNTISAFIKSMRASKESAAMYYLSRMIEAGEDPKFIARRMIIFASEDIGMQDSYAIIIANEVFKAVDVIGLPECVAPLSHGVAYLSRAKKDRSSYDAYYKAKEDVIRYGAIPIPLMLRNAESKLMKENGYGDGYELYGESSYMPKELDKRNYFI
ncbi:MAG: replication-associated recombination protein A [Candidatus Pacebacteria bacterium]|nr:replication-associated recombination protein A [Candidatus Paceibacterota bacterium]MBP9866546.1 replication-associated recombination protein A [Candidatus Paceibacterota bacterium]